MQTSKSDSEFMRHALLLADAVKGTTFPNPAVGAVIVKNGKIVGQGGTARCGGPHAEIRALRQAGDAARGAVLYVTLEPCCHQGRTPPCTDAIIRAGIKEVVAAAKDPNPLVNGKGLRALGRAGIRTRCGVCKDAACRLNEDFFWSVRHRSAWVSLKLALTWDGFIADERGDSRWITNEQARALAHDLRRRHAGIAIGRCTLIKDDPALTVRHVKGASPVRFVLTSHASLPRTGRLFSAADGVRSVIVVAGGAKPEKRRLGATERWYTGSADPVRSAKSFLRMAWDDGITSVLFEGGARTASILLENGLVNRLYLFYGNRILGDGLPGIRFVRGLPIAKPLALDAAEITVCGDNIMATGLVKRI